MNRSLAWIEEFKPRGMREVSDNPEEENENTRLRRLGDRIAASSLYDAARFYDEALNWNIVPMRENKLPAVKWSRYYHTRPDPREHDDWFNKLRSVKGLAVLTGRASAGLVCRDFDSEEAYTRWAQQHPDLARTLPTAATHRGRHVYFRNSTLVRTRTFADGELRAGTLCILPPSPHPKGGVYRWLVPPCLENLQEVKDINEAGFVSCETERTETNEHTERIELTEENRGNASIQEATVNRIPDVADMPEGVIECTLPKAEGQRHGCIFDLARALKGLPEYQDLPPLALKPVVRRWHELALPVIRTKAFEETWIDFLQAWPNVKFAKGESPIDEALRRARASEPPKQVRDYDQAELKLLASLCRELQRFYGEEPFFLSCRTAGELLGVDKSSTNRWLTLFVQENLLQMVKKGFQSGDKKVASRYRYLGTDLRPQEAIPSSRL